MLAFNFDKRCAYFSFLQFGTVMLGAFFWAFPPTPFPRTPIFHRIRQRSPTAIAGFIISLDVYSIQRCISRLWPEIFQKRFKAILPTFTDRDSSTAIMPIPWIFWITAALKHVVPSVPLNGASSALPMTMSKPEALTPLKIHTAAANVATSPQFRGFGFNRFTAIALAKMPETSVS
jgi:hypothetical protein